MSLLSLIPFLPVKWAYETVAEKLCDHWYQGKCRIYSPQLSSFLTNATLALMLLGTVIQMLLLTTKMDEFDQTLHRRKNRKNSDISSKRAASVHLDTDLDSDFDSLGDDHDTDDEEGPEGKNPIQNPTNKSGPNVLESHL